MCIFTIHHLTIANYYVPIPHSLADKKTRIAQLAVSKQAYNKMYADNDSRVFEVSKHGYQWLPAVYEVDKSTCFITLFICIRAHKRDYGWRNGVIVFV